MSAKNCRIWHTSWGLHAPTGSSKLTGRRCRRALSFDLATLGIAPGTYGFRFQVHVSEQYNVLHRGDLTVNDQASNLKLETVVGPGKLATTEEFIKDVQVHYVPLRK